MVLKTSMASMISLDMITILASTNSKKSKTACTLHTKIHSWYQDRQQRQWPQQPQWPQWPRHDSLFSIKLTELDVSTNPSSKMTYSGLSMWDESSQKHYFIDFWHSFWWRLCRPWRLLLTKFKGLKSNAITLQTCWQPYTVFIFVKIYSKLCLLYSTLPWLTLYWREITKGE